MSLSHYTKLPLEGLNSIMKNKASKAVRDFVRISKDPKCNIIIENSRLFAKGDKTHCKYTLVVVVGNCEEG